MCFEAEGARMGGYGYDSEGEFGGGDEGSRRTCWTPEVRTAARLGHLGHLAWLAWALPPSRRGWRPCHGPARILVVKPALPRRPWNARRLWRGCCPPTPCHPPTSLLRFRRGRGRGRRSPFFSERGPDTERQDSVFACKAHVSSLLWRRIGSVGRAAGGAAQPPMSVGVWVGASTCGTATNQRRLEEPQGWRHAQAHASSITSGPVGPVAAPALATPGAVGRNIQRPAPTRPAQEDVKLIQLVETYGPQNWSLIAKVGWAAVIDGMDRAADQIVHADRCR